MLVFGPRTILREAPQPLPAPAQIEEPVTRAPANGASVVAPIPPAVEQAQDELEADADGEEAPPAP
jgi:hypothetical protein